MSPTADTEATADTARRFAERDLRSDLKVGRFWGVVFVVLFVAFLASWFAGAFNGRSKWTGLVVFLVFFGLMFWGVVSSERRAQRSLLLVAGAPRFMALVSEQRRGKKSKRPVTLREGGAIVARAGPRDRRGALFLFSKPVPVFVFGELTPGQRVVVVGPHPRLVASLRLDG